MRPNSQNKHQRRSHVADAQRSPFDWIIKDSFRVFQRDTMLSYSEQSWTELNLSCCWYKFAVVIAVLFSQFCYGVNTACRFKWRMSSWPQVERTSERRVTISINISDVLFFLFSALTIHLNSPLQLIRHCTQAVHLTLLIFCNIINPQCPRALLPVSYLQFHGITYPLVLVPFVSLLREFGTP